MEKYKDPQTQYVQNKTLYLQTCRPVFSALVPEAILRTPASFFSLFYSKLLGIWQKKKIIVLLLLELFIIMAETQIEIKFKKDVLAHRIRP